MVACLIPDDLFLRLADSADEFAALHNGACLRLSELRRWDHKVTLPSSIYLAQLLRQEGINAIQWEASGADLTLNLCRSNFLPYNWELLQRRPNHERLLNILNEFAATHDFYTNYFQACTGLVPVEKAAEAIQAAKTRVVQLNKSTALRSLGAKLVFSKYEVTIRINSKRLMAYVHCHVIFAVLKGCTAYRVAKLRRDAARITRLKFGKMWSGAHGWLDYLMKHPLSLRWGKHCRGSFVRLGAVAQMTSQQAHRIYRALHRVVFMSFAPPDLVSCSQIGNLDSDSARAALEQIGKAEGLPGNAIESWWEIESQRREFEVAIRDAGLPRSLVCAARSRFRAAFDGFIEDARRLAGLGYPRRMHYLNSLATASPGPLRHLSEVIDAVELNL